MILEQWVPPPSHTTTTRERRAALASCGQNRERIAESDHSPWQRSHKKKKVLAARRSGSGEGSWEGTSAVEESEEEITPSPNMRKVFTQL
jgi:hypothetical protein